MHQLPSSHQGDKDLTIKLYGEAGDLACALVGNDLLTEAASQYQLDIIWQYAECNVDDTSDDAIKHAIRTMKAIII